MMAWWISIVLGLGGCYAAWRDGRDGEALRDGAADGGEPRDGEALSDGAVDDGCPACHTSPAERVDESNPFQKFGRPEAAGMAAMALAGRTDEELISAGISTVGSHGPHLFRGNEIMAIACTDCHEVPAAPHRPDGRPDVYVSGWDLQGSKCLTHHGDRGSPAWRPTLWSSPPKLGCTDEDGCHDAAKLSFHDGAIKARGICSKCHTLTNQDGKFTLEGKKLHGNGAEHRVSDLCGACHEDGHLKYNIKASFDCGLCHPAKPTTPFVDPAYPWHRKGGTTDPAASEVTLKPEGELCVSCHDAQTADRTHRTHLAPPSAKAVPCPTCHTVPATAERLLRHATPLGRQANVWFTGVKGDPRYTPGKTHLAGTCAKIPCHGSALPEGQTMKPLRWDDASGKPMDCAGGCHGHPPKGDAIHDYLPPTSACEDCHKHPLASPETHIDGEVTFR